MLATLRTTVSNRLTLLGLGRGPVLGLIAVGGLLATGFCGRAALGESYYASHGWPKLAGSWINALVIFCLRSWFGVGDSRNTEAMFVYLPARFWPVILVVVGV